MKKMTERKIYLVRHGKPDFTDGIRRCIGRTDIPLGETGKKRSAELKDYFAKYPVERIYTSPLRRCRKTAEILSNGRYPIQEKPGLIELDMGEWENIPLQDLKKDLQSEPFTGEGRIAGVRRFQKTINEILDETIGDIVCVAHAGVLCGYLSTILGTPLTTSRALPQPYSGISILRVVDNQVKSVEKLGIMTKEIPDDEKCHEIWEHYHTPNAVVEHCKAVAKKATEIGTELNAKGCGLDIELIRSAALLHDVARAKKSHPAEGARILLREGYPKVAELIAKHQDIDAEFVIEGKFEPCAFYEDRPNEIEVVYFADKVIFGTEDITLEQRFCNSKKRCEESKHPKAALEAHKKRYNEAKMIGDKILEYGRKL